MRRIDTILALVAFLSCMREAAAATEVIRGCEAADIRAGLARTVSEAASQTGPSSWRGPPQQISGWRFAPFASVSCDEDACRIETGLAVVEPVFMAVSDVARTDTVSIGTAGGAITGPAARSIRDGLGPAGFAATGGQAKRVWVDYGAIAGVLDIRARVAITCAGAQDHCSVQPNVLAFVAYDDTRACGDLAAAVTP